MEYEEVKCRACGAIMSVSTEARRIKCEYCGTEYVFSEPKPKYDPVKYVDYGGKGVIFKAYIPQNWNCKITDDNSVSMLAPVCKGLQLSSQNGAHLLFYPEAYYKNYAPGQNATAPGVFEKVHDYMVDGWSLICWRKLVEPTQYAYERLVKIYGNIGNLQITPENDNALNQALQGFYNEASRKLEGTVTANAYKFRVSFSVGGRMYNGCFATILAALNKSDTSVKNSSGGGFADLFKGGLGMFGGVMGGAKVKSDWGRAFDIVIAAPSAENFDCDNLLHGFIQTLEYGPVYYALQDEEMRAANQAQIYGAMTRQQNAIRASQQISRTLSETSDIVNSGLQEHSARMDRMGERYSEAIRGVNVYTDGDRRYEADVGYDHIYRSGDKFIGSKDGSLQLGPEWTELERE